MRSAIGRTSFSLWVMNSTEWPDFWSDRMIENRSSVSCGVSTAVGSSRISSRASRSSALMISTRCWTPTGRSSTIASGSTTRPKRCESSRTSRLAVARSSIPARRVGSIPRTAFSATVNTGTSMKCWWTMPMPAAIASAGLFKRTGWSSMWISPSPTVRSMPSLATTPGNRLVIPLSSSFKLPPQGGPRGGSSRSGPPRPCALLVVLRLHRDRARDDALLDGVDVVLELLGHLAVEVVVRGDSDAVVLQGADVGAALELVVDGALDGRLDRDVHVLLDAGQEQAAVLLRA